MLLAAVFATSLSARLVLASCARAAGSFLCKLQTNPSAGSGDVESLSCQLARVQHDGKYLQTIEMASICDWATDYETNSSNSKVQSPSI